MKKARRSIALLILSAGTIAVLLICIGFLSMQAGAQQNKQEQQPQVYNPYPPGILPPDLPQEIERVRGEIRFIESEAIGEWHALGPVTYTGQPPIIQGNGYHARCIRGKLMNVDDHLSPLKHEVCSAG